MKTNDVKYIQISADTHKVLKTYCKGKGLKIGKLIETLIVNEVTKSDNLRESAESWKVKKLLEELYNIPAPKVESVTNFNNI